MSVVTPVMRTIMTAREPVNGSRSGEGEIGDGRRIVPLNSDRPTGGHQREGEEGTKNDATIGEEPPPANPGPVRRGRRSSR